MQDDYYADYTEDDKAELLKLYKLPYKKMGEHEQVNYTVPYDLGSLMQYSSNAVMMPKDSNYETTMGSQFVSFYDKVIVNEHYKCTGKCDKEREMECENKGFLDPKTCTRCVCPSGYGGPYCKERSGSFTNITVRIISIYDGSKNAIGCNSAGVEIKTRDDQRLTGYR
ncbi:hypothetical protein ANCDUO_15679 [Ancylostoma duodenale]|uniref:Peptidase M12A domain-containing protein n=1 Tax=Ancylostoma duodenale TaxID=51022 RepID=A0A0C2GB79_9BILA|nr:hypothetical protein ANCDUO_15679 [Ancylostoma duodenale]